ncbi:MAG: thioredoxin-disulfide reductase [Lachnospiraceae bacterium]|nr:thioredoxin-disulfide reductase [Lachnospiraceae bacterium]MBQ4068491.1 thioredoxin-disulfide reductase [Lachnospiraceae bacterium]
MYDVVIIGSGPAGLSAAIYARRALLKVLIIDKNPMCGGQIINTAEVDNYLGMPGVSGIQMAMSFKAHADMFEPETLIGEVEGIRCEQNYNVIMMKDKTNLKTKTIIFATGAKYKLLNVKGEEEFKGRGVSYCATCDGAFFRQKKVAVVGGGDVALEDAIYLSKICNKVYLINRRNELRGSKHLQKRVFECENIEFLGDYVVDSINGDSKVKNVIIKNKNTQEERMLDVDGIFIAIGMVPESELLKGLVELDENGYVVAGEDTVTSNKSIFAVGDVRTKSLRQIITAAADGAVAVYEIEKYLNL